MRKALGSDDVAGWIVKERAQQLARPVHDIID